MLEMDIHLKELVKAYIPPWYVDEKITKEEARFDYTNLDYEIARHCQGYELCGSLCDSCAQGWVEVPLDWEDEIEFYYFDVNDFNPRRLDTRNLRQEISW